MANSKVLEKIRLRDKIKFLQPLLMAVLFFIISLFLDKSINYFNLEAEHNIDANEIERILHRKEKKLNAVLSDLSAKFSQIDNQFILEKEERKYAYDSLFFSDEYLNLNESGINLLIYKNDSLKYWTSSLISLNLKYSESYLGDRIIDFKNAIHRVKIQKKGGYIFVGLILIKQKYSYKNKLLKNNYFHEFNLPESIKISLLRDSQGTQIEDRNGNYLFTLIPSDFSVTEKPFFHTSISLYLLSLVFFLYFANRLIKKIYFFRRQDFWLLFLIAGLVYAKYLLFYYEIPSNIYFTDLYDPNIFAYSDFLSSVSEFLQLSIIIFLISFNFLKEIETENLANKIIQFSQHTNFVLKRAKSIFIFGFPLFLSFFYYLVLKLIRIIIVNSTIPFEIYKILKLNLFSLIGLLIIVLLLASFVLVLHKYIHISSKLVQIKVFLFACILLFFNTVIVFLLFEEIFDFRALIYLVFLVFLFVFVRFSKIFYPYYFYIFVLFISTVFSILYIDQFIEEKDLEIRNTLILPAMQEQDAVAEYILSELSEKIKSDKTINSIIFEEILPTEKLKNYLYRQHYPALWEEYDLKVKVCKNTDSIFVKEGQKKNCYDVYSDLIENQGIILEDSKFIFLDNENGRITYLGIFNYLNEENSLNYRLLLELNSKLRSSVIGFPKVLLNEKYYRKSRLEEYSYAKYINKHLVNQKGSYSYNYKLNEYKVGEKDSSVFELNNYQHLLKRNPTGYTVIISKKHRTLLDMLVSLSYVFVLYYVFLNIILVINKIPFYYKEFKHGLKFRIQFSMVSILFLSILTVGSLSIYYIMKQSERNYSKNVKRDLTAVINELEYEFNNQVSLDSVPQEEIYQVLKRLANVFSSDIQLFSTNGDLIASSMPEIFERNLLGFKIAPRAYEDLQIKGGNYFNSDEKLGELGYLSAYAKLSNIDNTTLAYVNMPFFLREKILQEEVSNFVVSVINIFALLLLIAVVIAIFISNKMVQPLRLVQSKFSEVKLGKTNEQILYSRDDEIGGLIKEYNRMLLELAKSARKLGKSEREGAWREMAKQIAHEIKNPLTPMKLNMQLLKKSWDDNDPDFPLRIENVSNTLVEQIDRLSSIATSFSNFAKIPSAKNSKFNIRASLESALILFDSFENLTLSSNIEELDDEIFIFADEEQISRAIINLIKNAHQAKKENIDSFIHIELFNNSERAIIKITDNGTGIPENLKDELFRPNFTTKTSGMGLGLSIVKNIIENAQGKVWFVTELNIGTSFYVQLPVFKDENRI